VLESWVVQSPKQVLRSRGINEREAGFVSAPMNPPGIHFNQASNSSKVGLQSEAKNVTASTIGVFCERCSEKVGGWSRQQAIPGTYQKCQGEGATVFDTVRLGYFWMFEVKSC